VPRSWHGSRPCQQCAETLWRQLLRSWPRCPAPRGDEAPQDLRTTFAQIGTTVSDLGAVALDNRLDQSREGVDDTGFVCGSPLAQSECGGVSVVLHEKKKLALGLRIQRKGPCADIGLLRDLLGSDLVDAILSE
jgi:hypothetical protein